MQSENVVTFNNLKLSCNINENDNRTYIKFECLAKQINM